MSKPRGVMYNRRRQLTMLSHAQDFCQMILAALAMHKKWAPVGDNGSVNLLPYSNHFTVCMSLITSHCIPYTQ